MGEQEKVTPATTKPGTKFTDEIKGKMIEAGVSDEEIRVLEVIRHVFYGHILIHKKAGKIEGRIEAKETY